MTLPTPILDDRTYEQLRDELLARIPVYTPEWSDWGPSDPGITLLELVAFLGENLLYRFNQIPDQTQLWLLRLLQATPRPARPARGIVAFVADLPNAISPPAVPLGASVSAGAVPFRVGNDVTVHPLTATAVVKASAAMPVDPDLAAEAHLALDAAALIGDEVPALFTTTVLQPDPTAAGFVPLDVSTAVDNTLWIAVRGAPGATPATLAALLAPDGPLSSAPLVLGVVGEIVSPTMEEVDPCDRLDEAPMRARLEASALRDALAACAQVDAVPGVEPPAGAVQGVDSTIHWQVSSSVPNANGSADYLTADVVADTTHGLTRDGVVSVQLPRALLALVGSPVLDDPDLAGVGNRPPHLDGDPVLFWLRAFPRQGVPEIGRVRWLGANAADVEQVAEEPPRFLGQGTGLPHQELALGATSVVPETVTIEVEEQGRWTRWEVVETLAGSGRADRQVRLDAETGIVRGGDGTRGRTFGIDSRIRCRSFRHGGGAVGNVPAGGISKIEVTGVRVTNPVAAVGGADAESIASALERIPGELARHDRAVTSSDFRELAGLPGVGRTECLPRFDPVTKSFEAAGVVTVVVWPRSDPLHPDAPVPDAALLRAVCEHLDARRLITTELRVVPPKYRKVAVSVGVAVKPGYSAVAVRRWVELVLRQYVSPLPPFGPDGRGWPLGRRVHGPELEAAVLQVEGVEYVEAMEVADTSGDVPVPGSVVLDGWEVVELSEVSVVAGGDIPAPGSGGVQPPAANPVPVPVPKDEC